MSESCEVQILILLVRGEHDESPFELSTVVPSVVNVQDCTLLATSHACTEAGVLFEIYLSASCRQLSCEVEARVLLLSLLS